MAQQRIWGTLHPFYETGPVMGRKEANAGFLTTLLRENPFDAYHFFIKTFEEKQHLEQTLQSRFPAMWENGRFSLFPVVDLSLLVQRQAYSCFHLSDWVQDYVSLAIIRNACSRNLFPLTAPVHTLSYASFGPQLFRHIWPGVTKRDRIVATSTATHEVLETYFSQFRSGYGLGSSMPSPALAQIPLGMDMADFASPEEKEAAGREVREKLAVGTATVFLSFSRISPLSKMDCMPFFDAFCLARDNGLDLSTCRFVMAGTLADKALADTLVQHAKERGVPFSLVAFPDQPNPALRKALFAAADVFLSPVDNVQETFGLTILEAFAASLPVIASAIDGYKDLVDHESDGFLLPTLGPSSLENTTAIAPLVMPDFAHLFMAQQCVVDLPAFGKAIHRLGVEAETRRQMGQNGRNKVLARYTWTSVVKDYLALWARLAGEQLTAEEEARARTARHPIFPDYANVFKGYFSDVASSPAIRERRITVSAKGSALLEGKGGFALYKLMQPRLDVAALPLLLEAARNTPTFGELADDAARPNRVADRDSHILWLLKHGYLEFSE